MIGAISGAGHIYNNLILRGANELKENYVFAEPEYNLFLQFFTVSNLFVDSVYVQNEALTLIDLDFELNIIGGLKKLTILFLKSFSVKLLNQMKVKVWINNSHYFTGLITYTPNEDTTETVINYEGEGFISQLDGKIIDLVYENKTIVEILTDLINVQAADTDIIFNSDFIDPISITLTKFEVNKKSIRKAIDQLLEICNVNFNSEEFEYGVNRDNIFYFFPIDKTAIILSYFEGYHFQKPKVKTSIKNIINKIIIFRTLEGSDVTEEVSSISDAVSIDKYGLKEKKITYSNFYDTSTVEDMAEFIIEKFKNPSLSIDIQNLASTIYDELLPFGVYRINNKPDNYTRLIDDCTELAAWNLTSISNTTITLESYYIYSGRKSFKCVTAAGSNGEYIQIEFDPYLWFQTGFSIYVYQETASEILQIELEDSWGAIETMKINCVQANQFIKYSGSYNKYNVKYLRIKFLTNEVKTVYIDRVDFTNETWSSNDSMLRKIKCKIKNGQFIYDLNFGELEKSAVDNLKELNDKTADIYSIFENV